jgi:hypothetical protein
MGAKKFDVFFTLVFIFSTISLLRIIQIDQPDIDRLTFAGITSQIRKSFYGNQILNSSSQQPRKTLLICIILLSGDIETNPGPVKNAEIFPCGLCDLPVTWEHVNGICCDGCDIWHHRSSGA